MFRLKSFRLDAYKLYLTSGFAESFFFGMIFTVLAVYYVQEVGLNPLQLVLVGTLLEATIFIFEIPTGIVADVYSRRLSVVIGFALIGLCYVAQGVLPLFAAILAAEFVRGVGETFISGAYTAWIADEIGEARMGHAFLRKAQFQRIGALLGIGAGTALAAAYSPALPVFLGGILLVVLSLVLAFTMPETGFQPIPRGDRTTWQTLIGQTREGLWAVRRQPVVLMFVLVGVFYGAFSEGFDRLWEAHLLQNFAFPAWLDAPPVVWIGLLNGASFVVSILISEVLIRRLNLRSELALGRTLLITALALIILLVLFGISPNFGVAATAFLLIGAVRSLQAPLSNAWLNRNIPAQVRATVLSLIGQTDAFGQIAGGPAVGAVGLRSLRSAMLFSAVILVPVILIYARAMKGAVKRE